MGGNGVACSTSTCAVPESGAPAAVPGSARIFVVADDPQSGVDLDTVLVGAGFEVFQNAAGCYQAVNRAAAYRPDLVVMDVRTPGTHGSGVIREITDRAIAPVVLLTTAALTGLIQDGFAAGAVACLVAPFLPSSLVATVELVLFRLDADGVRRDEAAGLLRQLEDRNLVERAKGLLMFHQQMTEAQAHRWLQQTAMRRRVKMARVANGVIERWVIS